MKRRINFGMLKHFKTIAYEAENKHHFIPLYTQSYKLINSILKDINQPFCNVCIHGRFPELIIPALH